MRLFWIIVGIVAIVWLGMMHFQQKEIHQDIDRHEQRLTDVEDNMNNDGNLDIGEEIQDEADDAQEEIQDGIPPTKEENLDDQAKDKQEELKEEQQEKESKLEDKMPNENSQRDEKNPNFAPDLNPNPNDPNSELPKPRKDIETSLPKDATSYNQESVVAFGQESIVAYSAGYNESEVAYKNISTPTLGIKDVDASEAYLIIDPILLSLK
jgi:hypothetical protein